MGYADFQPTDKNVEGTAINVAVDELEELQLSLLEAARLAGLDSIQVHDAQFAVMLANLPDDEWEETGDLEEDPFLNPPFSLDAVDIKSVLGECGSSGTKEEVVHVLKRAKVSDNHTIIREGKAPLSSTVAGKQKVIEDNNRVSLTPALRKLVATTSDPDSETTCQICFDSEQTTSTFVTLEGTL